MSLLMDALKKAERARAAKEQGEDAAPEQALSLEEPGADTGEQRVPPAPSSPQPPPAAGILEESDSFADLQLSEEQLRENEISLELEPELPPLTPRPRFDEPLARPPQDTGTLGRPSLGGDTSAVFGSPEDTSATLPSLKAARDSVNSYFDGTASTSLAMEGLEETETTGNTTGGLAPEAYADQPALDLDAGYDDTTITGERVAVERDHAAQQAARTVFAAKNRRRGSGTRWTLFLALPVVLIGACVAGYFYWLSLGTNSGIRGPAVAETSGVRPVAPTAVPRVNPPVTNTSTPAPGSTPGVGAGVTPAAPGTANTPSAAIAQTTEQPPTGAATLPAAPAVASAGTPEVGAAPVAPAKPPPPRGDLTPGKTPTVAPTAPVATVIPPAAPAASEVGDGELSEEQFARYLARASRVPDDLSRGGGIRIAKGRARNVLGQTVNSAYEAYQRGDDSLADNLYRSVLRRKPGHRDALLGLAAIAMRNGDSQLAVSYYQQLLRLYPNDSVAQAALMQALPEGDPVTGETELKSLLARSPDAPHLNFALGNTYASQARWPQAQEAYFNALRGDGTNPDYAFNLAVSLDQLGQHKAALDFYLDAVDYAKARPAAFPAGSALQRIAAMQAGQR
ncbi:MAG: tetratricopeptide repeat protein [Gammaproteobacteria bacterium]|nr:tetratricopeptide repeat protein [Gammaproteobacteria bacterium]